MKFLLKSMLLILLLLCQSIYAGWEVQNDEGPTGRCVAKTNDGSLLLLTSTGEIKRSTNSGVNWSTVGAGDGSCDYFKFYNNSGFLPASDKLYYTQNMGLSWQAKEYPKKQGYDFDRKLKLTFSGNGQEYALLDSIYAPGKHALFKSATGSNSWQEVAFPQIKKYTSNGPIYRSWCRSVQFINNIGWAAGDSLRKSAVVYKTTDGGSNWSRIKISTYQKNYEVREILFLDQNRGWIRTDSSGFKTTLYRTVDGGVIWTALPSISDNVEFINFTDANTGYYNVYSNEYKTFKTVDGGVTWLQCNFSGKPYFYTSQEGYMVSGTNLYKTIDGGSNWQTQSLEINPFLDFAGLNSVCFSSESNGWVSGNVAEKGVNVARTVNGGQTWLDKRLPEMYKGWFINASACVNPSLAYFVADTGSSINNNSKAAIFKTIDGGSSYAKLSLPAVDSQNWSFYGVNFMDYKTGYAIGYAVGTTKDGLILKTMDGGVNWQKTIIPKTDDKNYWFFDIACPTADISIIASGGWDNTEGQIFATNNNGSSWQKQSLPAVSENKGLLSLSFISQFEGWAAGKLNNNGKNCILKTTDGGANWQTIEVATGDQPVMKSIYKISFVNSQMGWLGGNDDYYFYIYKTTDGGITWKMQSKVKSPHSRTSLSFISENIGWAVSGDVIMKTANGGVTGIDEGVSQIVNSILLQNYPNPFNNTTSINFTLPKAEYATLTLCNIKGEIVKQFAAGSYTAGSHSVSFNAQNLATGIYIYTLQTKGQKITNRMLLLK